VTCFGGRWHSQGVFQFSGRRENEIKTIFSYVGGRGSHLHIQERGEYKTIEKAALLKPAGDKKRTKKNISVNHGKTQGLVQGDWAQKVQQRKRRRGGEKVKATGRLVGRTKKFFREGEKRVVGHVVAQKKERRSGG